MVAYVVGQLDIQDSSWVEEYGPRTEALIQKHGGRYLARAGAELESLEGQEPLPSAVVILEFPSPDRHFPSVSADYADMIVLRCTGSDADIMLLGNE